MRLMVREVEGTKLIPRRYRSWGHYKASRGYPYIDPPEEEYEAAIKLVEVPCGTCWGQRVIASINPDGEGYARESCPTCFGSGFRITILA